MSFKVENVDKGKSIILEEFYNSMANQKYRKHYERLIYRAQWRIFDTETYCERHHIIPKCLGGSNFCLNIVKLTAEEHYLAHQLLVRLYPKNKKVIHSAILMASKSPDLKRSGNKVYSWLRRRMSEIQKGVPRTPEVAANIAKANKARTGNKLSNEHKIKLSLAGKGRIVSEETRRKLSAANITPEAVARIRTAAAKRKGKKLTLEQREKMKGRKLSPEHIEKLRQLNLGKKASKETIAKMSQARKNPSAEVRKKMSEAQSGRKHSEATKIKIGNNNRVRGVSSETRLKMSERAKNMTDERKEKIGAASKLSRQKELELGVGMYSEESIKKRSASIKASWDRRKAAASGVSI
jgi:hypothetical protein